MDEGVPSRTAYRVALRRAAHQLWDRPLVFEDPLALRILGLAGAHAKELAASDLRAPTRPSSMALRAFLVARSRFAEDALRETIERTGLEQYVLLGAGLDTFAYRNPFQSLRVFEIDHPATQAWKLELLHANGIAVPASVRHVPVDFQTESLAERLTESGFEWSRPAAFAWLGVIPYLTDAGFTTTLSCLSSGAAGSSLILDYGLPRSALPPVEQLAFDSLAARVAAAGEPLHLFFTPEQMQHTLGASAWQVVQDLDRDAINQRFFANRSDGLRCLGSGGHLLHAVLCRRS